MSTTLISHPRQFVTVSVVRGRIRADDPADSPLSREGASD
jgi:hypothetical protein